MIQGKDVNPNLAGKNQSAIFGFCDIRNFTDATEVLQEEVMVFVNSIAKIVHSTVDKFLGSSNKNIGDAFLLVWKLPNEETHFYYENNGGNQLKKKTIREAKNFSDLALISFLKMIARINKKPEILEYRKKKELSKRIPNYRVKMGFGLHVGIIY